MQFTDSENEQFHRHLKEKLDALKSKAPVGLWDGISLGLNQTESDTNDDTREAIDEKIKKAATEQSKAPETIWYGIEQKLNLDEIWNRMQPELNRLRQKYYFRKITSYISAAAILLLFLRTCSPEVYEFGADSNQNEIKISKSENNQYHNFPKINISSNSDNNFIKTDNNEFTFQGLMAENSIQKNIDTINKNEAYLTENSVEIDAEINSLNVNNHNIEQQIHYKTAEIIVNPALLELEKRPLSLISLDEFKSTNDDFLALKNKSKIEYRVGTVATVKASVFSNYQNSSKLNRLRADDVTFNLNPSFSYGINLGVKKASHALSAEFWFDSREKQVYSYTVSGRRHHDITKLSYVRVNLLYKLDLFRYRNTSITATLGPYLSNLKGARYSSTIPNRNLYLSELHNWNGGIILGIAQEYKMGSNFVLECGLRNEIGFASIYNAGGNIHLKSNLMGFSAFMGLNYRF